MFEKGYWVRWLHVCLVFVGNIHIYSSHWWYHIYCWYHIKCCILILIFVVYLISLLVLEYRVYQESNSYSVYSLSFQWITITLPLRKRHWLCDIAIETPIQNGLYKSSVQNQHTKPSHSQDLGKCWVNHADCFLSS